MYLNKSAVNGILLFAIATLATTSTLGTNDPKFYLQFYSEFQDLQVFHLRLLSMAKTTRICLISKIHILNTRTTKMSIFLRFQSLCCELKDLKKPISTLV